MSNQQDLRVAYRRLFKRIKNFLFSPKSRKFLVFVLFFFLATFFWLLDTLNDTYETNLSFPLQMTDIPANVVITSDPIDHLEVKVRDKGGTLLNYSWSRNFHSITLSFNDFARLNNRVRVDANDFKKEIMTQLSPSSEVVSVKPDTLEYIYTTGLPKLVPVIVSRPTTVESQYYISGTWSKPDSVLVFAPASVLRTITAVRTDTVSIDKMADTIRRSVRTQPLKGVKYNPNRVDVKLAIDMFTEKTIEVPIVGVRFPSNQMLRTFPSKASVTFQVGMSHFRSINARDFAIEIAYSDVINLQTDKYTLRATRLPKGVQNVRINPAQVDFLIEHVPSRAR